jgi:hypothetical protein
MKTEIAKRMLHCETKYISANKVLYTITWKEDRAEWMVSSERSSSGAVSAFLKVSKKLAWINYSILIIIWVIKVNIY